MLLEELLKVGTHGYGTLRPNRYPGPYKVGRSGIKLRPGEIRQLQKGNLVATVWYDKCQVATLSTNCQPDEKVTVQRQTKEPPYIKEVDIPAPTSIYNKHMGGVDLSDQMRSYYPSGRPGKKWWRYLLWFLLDVSICNAFVLERLSLHATSSRSRRSLLHFKLELAKQLIGGFSGRKRYPGRKRKYSSNDNAVALPNLPGHQQVQFQGRKRACVQCSNYGQKTPSGCTPETTYGCNRCGVNLCHNSCFLHYHTENSHI